MNSNQGSAAFNKSRSKEYFLRTFSGRTIRLRGPQLIYNNCNKKYKNTIINRNYLQISNKKQLLNRA